MGARRRGGERARHIWPIYQTNREMEGEGGTVLFPWRFLQLHTFTCTDWHDCRNKSDLKHNLIANMVSYDVNSLILLITKPN